MTEEIELVSLRLTKLDGELFKPSVEGVRDFINCRMLEVVNFISDEVVDYASH